jgi:hypothetical protein
MKRIFFVAATLIALCSCSDTGTKTVEAKDSTSTLNSTAPTPTNTGGLQPNGGINGSNMSDIDTSASSTNTMKHDSLR